MRRSKPLRGSWIVVAIVGLSGLWSGMAPTKAVGLDPAESWEMGDCNRDRFVDVVDAVSTLRYLFRGNAPEPCMTLCDVDSSGDLNLVDPILILRHLFVDGRNLGTPPPPESERCDRHDNNCDGEVDEGCPSPPGRVRSFLELRWRPVTEDIEGEPEEIAFYVVYWGTQPGVYTGSQRVVLPGARLEELDLGVTYYLAVTAVDLSGNESDYSREISAQAEPVEDE